MGANVVLLTIVHSSTEFTSFTLCQFALSCSLNCRPLMVCCDGDFGGPLANVSVFLPLTSASVMLARNGGIGAMRSLGISAISGPFPDTSIHISVTGGGGAVG